MSEAFLAGPSSGQPHAHATKRFAPGERPNIYNQPPPEDHIIRMSVELDYFLERSGVPLHTRPRNMTTRAEERRKKRAPDDYYHKFYITYDIAGGYESKTDILSFDSNSWSATHEIEVNTEFISEFYERPLEFTIWEVVRNEEADKIQGIKLSHRAHKFGSRTRISPLTEQSRQESIDAMNKRRFNLANTGMTLLERREALRRASARKAEQLQRRPQTLAEELAEMRQMVKMVGGDPNAITTMRDANGNIIEGEISRGGVEKEFLTNVTRQRPQPQPSRIPDEADEVGTMIDLQGVVRVSIPHREHSEDERPGRRSRRRSRTRSRSPPPPERDSTSGYLQRKSAIEARKAAPHPHHFDHPDRHVAPDGVGMGSMYRSRSALSLMSRTVKEGPAPHHTEHPMLTLYPRGRSRSRGNPGSSSTSRAHSPARSEASNNSGSRTPTYRHYGHHLDDIELRNRRQSLAESSGSISRSRSADRSSVAGGSGAARSGTDPHGNGHSRGSDTARFLDVHQGRQSQQRSSRGERYSEARHFSVGRTSIAEAVESDGLRIVSSIASDAHGGSLSDIPPQRETRETKEAKGTRRSTKSRQRSKSLEKGSASRPGTNHDGEPLPGIEYFRIAAYEAEAIARGMTSHRKRPKKPKEPEFKHIVVGKLQIDVTELFLGETLVRTDLQSKIDGFHSCRIGVSLNKSLLSKEQAMLLNPMCLTIVSANDMPRAPVPFDKLQRECANVNTKFRFFEDPHIYTAVTEHEHGPFIPFHIRHLILPGIIDEDKLRQELMSSVLEIEVHDRDYKLPDDLNAISQEFGTDGKIGQVLNPRNPYGVATFRLHELASGETTLVLSAPILPSRERKDPRATQPQGHLLEAGSYLIIKIDLKYPILASNLASLGSLADGLFDRIIIATSFKEREVLEKVERLVADRNATALSVYRDNEQQRRKVLRNYILSVEQRCSLDLDIITGYEVYDDNIRVFFLEGLIDGSILDILQELPNQDGGSYQIFHSPHAAFTDRIWANLSPGIEHIRLEPSLNEVMQQTSTYLRSKISPECFEILSTLKQIVFLRSQKKCELPRGLFPSLEMFQALLRNYAVKTSFEESYDTIHFQNYRPSRTSPRLRQAAADRSSQDHLKTEQYPHKSQQVTPASSQLNAYGSNILKSKKMYAHSTAHELFTNELREKYRSVEKKVDDSNGRFEGWLADHHRRQPNVINLYKNQYQARTAPRKRDHQHKPVHNYSIQETSAISEQLELLRSRMAERPDRIYTYGSQYFSQTLAPVDVAEEIKREEFASRTKWITPEGFRSYPLVSQPIEQISRLSEEPWVEKTVYEVVPMPIPHKTH